MKKLFLSLLLMCMVGVCRAERELFPVNWKQMEEVAKNQCDSVRALAKRLSADTLDRSLTWEERRLAIYGMGILCPCLGTSKTAMDGDEYYGQGKYEEALECAKSLLKENPLNTKALSLAERSILKMVKNGSKKYTKSNAEIYYLRAQRVYNTIATTGNGSEDYPLYVTEVPDEYNFMRYFLEIWEFTGQKLVGTCDVITLGETSQYYNAETVWFDATWPLKVLQRKFEK